MGSIGGGACTTAGSRVVTVMGAAAAAATTGMLWARLWVAMLWAGAAAWLMLMAGMACTTAAVAPAGAMVTLTTCA